MKYKKFRELSFDPYSIKFKNTKIERIINYMPAGNDVIECTCYFNNIYKDVFIKFERSKMADFKGEIFNLEMLKKHNLYKKIPEILEFGVINDKRYIILSKIKGKRLSEILIGNDKRARKKYLLKYGMELAKIHNISPNFFLIAKQRVINNVPSVKYYGASDDYILEIIDYLKRKKPEFNNDIFIHGDFHYANILWRNGQINGVLDYEYSGKGFKEQDIAWAIVLRPGQKFFDCYDDVEFFLEGYNTYSNFDHDKLKWCLLNAYCHFYLMNIKNKEYTEKIKKLISIIMKY